MDPKLVVVRDLFALQRLSNEALQQIAPTLDAAIETLRAEIADVLEATPLSQQGRLAWFIAKREDTIAVLEAQLSVVAGRLEGILPAARLEAFRHGIENARDYMVASGVVIEPPAPPPLTLEQAGVVVSAPAPIVATATEVLATRTHFAPRPYRLPAITAEQYEAVARGGTVSGIGRLGYDMTRATRQWVDANVDEIVRELDAGFLLSRTNEQIRDAIEGRVAASRRQVEAIVRTSMASASQAAHDAFYEANATQQRFDPETGDVEEVPIIGDRNGFKWRWDASNDARLCKYCAPLDDTRYRERKDVPRHPAHFNCRCVVLPITALDEQLPPKSGTFLDLKPARKSGKRWVREPGWDHKAGDPAYARPQRIDGRWYWVKRRDLEAGRTTAGYMLQQASDEQARLVLGNRKRLLAFRQLTGPGGRYEADPQQAVIELLRPQGLPGETFPAASRWRKRERERAR
jgi:hypothetical protein